MCRWAGLWLAGFSGIAARACRACDPRLANSLIEGVRPTVVKDQIEHPATIAYEKWNSFSRITVGQPERTRPALWGPSPRFVADPIEQRWMNIDGGAGTAVYRFSGDLNELAFLRYDVTNLAYAVPGLQTGAVIGVGGGRDLFSARVWCLRSGRRRDQPDLHRPVDPALRDRHRHRSAARPFLRSR